MVRTGYLIQHRDTGLFWKDLTKGGLDIWVRDEDDALRFSSRADAEFTGVQVVCDEPAAWVVVAGALPFRRHDQPADQHLGAVEDV